ARPAIWRHHSDFQRADGQRFEPVREMTASQPKVLWKLLASDEQDLVYNKQTIQPMKTYNPIVHIFSLACACLILVGCETTQQSAATAPPPPNSARLHVDRVANFGSDLVL